jgi:hypothetical protein
MAEDYSQLPWNFEAFRKFIDYRTLQNAASVICLFESRDILTSPKELDEFETAMKKRTGLEWSPERLVSEDINFNIEGNLFRNKARVLTSLYLVDPIVLKNENKVKPTPFCLALGAGYINADEFYKEIISRFTYPHPAYDENWEAWTAKGIELKPLIFILDILVNLADSSADQAYFSVAEFAEFAHASPIQAKAHDIASSIIENRKSGQRIERQRSDKVERKISDIFGFMCMSQFCYYDKNLIRLNLMGSHAEENVNFMTKRGEYDVLQQTKEFINKSLGRD